MGSDLFVSYIIPTIGRASLSIAVNSVLRQHFTRAEFEVIIVNDSGSPLPQGGWDQSQRVKVINTNRCERCYARNSGAAVAKGQYLAFLDDDDWILPGAIECFWQLAQEQPNAGWLFGGIQIMDGYGQTLKEINTSLNGNCFSKIMGGAWAPIQASLILSDAFFEAGGYNPFILGTEDEDLCRRIAFSRDIANTPQAVACLFRGQTWNTSSNYLRAPEDTKYSRDLIFSKPGVFQRLHASADSPYWHGRNLRVYLSTVAWNLKKKRIFTAISRSMYSLTAFVLSIPHVLSPDYWAGVQAEHAPDTLHFVIEEYERALRTAKF